MKSVVCITAQHRQMLDQPLELFCIKPKYDLDIMRNKQSLAQITSRSIEGLNKVFARLPFIQVGYCVTRVGPCAAWITT